MDVLADFVGGDLFYKNYTHLSYDEAVQVLTYRNDENVRKWMLNDLLIPLDSHIAYINQLKTQKDRSYWAVFQNNYFVGGVSITNYTNNSASTGIFVNPGLIGSGIGLKIAFYFNDYLFKELGLSSTYSVVHKNNRNAIQLNKFIGVSFVNKNGLFYDIHHNRESWDGNRAKLLKYLNYI